MKPSIVARIFYNLVQAHTQFGGAVPGETAEGKVRALIDGIRERHHEDNVSKFRKLASLVGGERRAMDILQRNRKNITVERSLRAVNGAR